MRIRTGYSFRQAAGSLDAVMEAISARGAHYPAAPITDRASTFGWVKWNKMCQKADVKPVFGVELAVSRDPTAKKPAVDYWTFIAKNDIEAINDLIGLATEQFRYEPLLSYDQAIEAPGVWTMVGSRSDLERVPSKPHILVGLAPSVPRIYAEIARKRRLKLVATSDNRYPRPGDQGLYEVIAGRNASTQVYPQYIQTDEEWRASVSRIADKKVQDAALKLRNKILLGTTAKLVKAEIVHPARPKPLRQMCEEGAALLGCDLSDPVYAARLERELTLIHDKGFEDYFYIVEDLCRFARERMIVGPARGSSCGSLVCYLLRITTVDPIPFGLIFERFIDVNRSDLPDIDIDFSDQARHLVFEYANAKYGADRVARLGTVALYKPRSALSEAGAALRVPPWKCDAVAESLIERSSGDARALQSLEDTFTGTVAGKELMADYPEMMIAAKMEGHPRHYSQHAAGIVISEHPVTKVVAVDRRTGATMCDKKDAEDLDLLKIDALGLTQLSVFEDALELAGLPRDALEKLPLDDPAAFEVINNRSFSGIFQFNGRALQSIADMFKVDKFDDIVSITALARPGPLASGGANQWIRRRNGEAPVTYPHPIFEPYLGDTLGIVLYQEQVMEIGRHIGDLDWGQVTALRKAMSRSLGKEFFDQFGDPWKAGAIAKGVDPAVVDKVWDDLCAYGSWSFNKSHSVAYALISYWCCWLKAHHPFEFAAATLSHEKDPARQIQLLREMRDEGFGYVPVDAERSGRKWTVGERDGKPVLVGPLSNVKGIGPKVVEQIMAAREAGHKMPTKAAKLLANPVTPIDSLWPIADAFRRVMPDPAERNIHTPPTRIIDAQIRPQDYTVLFFATFSQIAPLDENEPQRVAKRGYAVKGDLTAALNLQITDDTDTIFGKINRFKFAEVGKPIIDRGRPGKALYAIKGTVKGGGSFRMIMVDMVRYIGDVEEGHEDRAKRTGDEA